MTFSLLARLLHGPAQYDLEEICVNNLSFRLADLNNKKVLSFEYCKQCFVSSVVEP